jgi:hypothetical protein
MLPSLYLNLFIKLAYRLADDAGTNIPDSRSDVFCRILRDERLAGFPDQANFLIFIPIPQMGDAKFE